MLGNTVSDERGVEGEPGCSTGFGLLDCETHLHSDKQLLNCVGQLSDTHVRIEGYEIHTGITSGQDLDRPVIVDAYSENDDNRERYCDGATSLDGLVKGTYWHGLFDCAEALDDLMAWAGLESTQLVDLNEVREIQINRLADAFENSVDMSKLLKLLDEKQ
jgi:adenosylcobyric acid synthase